MLAAIEKSVDAMLASYAVLERAERQTGVRKSHLLGFVMAVTLSIPLAFLFPGLICAPLSLVYPLWATARAAEGHDKAEDVQWLAYWLCYGLLALSLGVTEAPILRRFFPKSKIMAIARALFLVYLYAPPTRGATLVWNKALRPLLHAVQSFCPKLSRSPSSRQDKKKADVAKTLKEMRNRSKSASGEK
jgi:receptor expression-enhancing protein 5/6